jgi:hypothetical protein
VYLLVVVLFKEFKEKSGLKNWHSDMETKFKVQFQILLSLPTQARLLIFEVLLIMIIIIIIIVIIILK